ncbi:hypothetical protein J2Z69_001351 [Paenibacillus shirakamiensis]|uniref:Lipoprotein n=1 Tax=Paenibacillus shirakamiensis TaxID=1265935 RepID=A0ABS4JF56_9BACL|nr:hypothetical protein [Paenibacillus shirakamiensis]MBP2000332.1 hypothetical protein [Paenibacillus shirakamiensis]
MSKNTGIFVLIAAALLLGGCESSSADKQPQEVSDTKQQISPPLESSKVEKSPVQPEAKEQTTYYQRSPKAQLQWKDAILTWSEGDVQVRAERAPFAENNQLVVQKLLIKQGSTQHQVDYKDPIQLESLSLSSDHKFLAIHVQTAEGYSLTIVNQKTGEYYDLNTYLSRNGRGNVDTVDDYNWSPKGSRLALAYGNNLRSSIALFDPELRRLEDIPSPVLYMTTPVILWGATGNFFDFVSIDDSSKPTLHRYQLQTHQMEDLGEISAEELNRLEQISPSYSFS